MQGVSFKLCTEPFLEPCLGWLAGQGVPRCSVRDAQCSCWHWEEQAPTWYLEMPAETHQLASPGAIQEAEEGWGKEPACSGCLTFSLFSTEPDTPTSSGTTKSKAPARSPSSWKPGTQSPCTSRNTTKAYTLPTGPGLSDLTPPK